MILCHERPDWSHFSYYFLKWIDGLTRKLYITDNCGSVISCGIHVATLKDTRDKEKVQGSRI